MPQLTAYQSAMLLIPSMVIGLMSLSVDGTRTLFLNYVSVQLAFFGFAGIIRTYKPPISFVMVGLATFNGMLSLMYAAGLLLLVLL